MSRIVVFVGPTLTSAEVHAILPDADVRAPVEQGDVIDAALDPDCELIAIVDGLFERVPAVWHKEILWAMARGVHVLGAASMGALRAAELHAFGMEGVGEIFEAFRDGSLDADDEVAVVHAPADAGHRAASVALVDVRATVGAAVVAGIAGPELRDAVVRAAKRVFYPDRTYARILEEARASGAPAGELDAFERFCRSSRIEQKRLDAIELCETVRARVAAGLTRKSVEYALQHTGYLDQVIREVLHRRARRERNSPIDDGALVDEVRLDPERWARVHALALSLAVARKEAEASGVRFADERALSTAAEAFRRERELHSPESFAAFLDGQRIDDDELAHLLASFAEVRWHGDRWRDDALARHPDALRLLGLFAAVHERALAKRAALAARGVSEPSLSDAGISEAELLSWYFGERLGRDVPADLDAYARTVGLSTAAELVKTLVAERIYTRLP